MRAIRTWLWVFGLAVLAVFAYWTWQSSHVEGETINAVEGYGTSVSYSVAYETSFLIQVGLVWLATVLIAGYVGCRLARRRQ